MTQHIYYYYVMATTRSLRCCACNGPHAVCKGCKCVKNGSSCSSCLPNEREKCQNSFVPPTAVSPTRPVPPFPPGPPTISLPSVAPSNTRTSGSVTQLPLHSLSATHLSGPSPSRGEDQVGGAVVPPSCEATPNRPCVPDLPPYSPLQSPGDFTWGDLDAASFFQSVMAAYNEVLHWRKNFFPVLYGSVGKRFVRKCPGYIGCIFSGGCCFSCCLYNANSTPPEPIVHIKDCGSHQVFGEALGFLGERRYKCLGRGRPFNPAPSQATTNISKGSNESS